MCGQGRLNSGSVTSEHRSHGTSGTWGAKTPVSAALVDWIGGRGQSGLLLSITSPPLP